MLDLELTLTTIHFKCIFILTKSEGKMKMMNLLISAVIGALFASVSLYYFYLGHKTTDQKINLTNEWDKTFQKSDLVETHKVTFKNRFGITLVGDLYIPKNKENKPLPAIAVSGPFGAVKEQVSGRYAQTMAERGFITLAFDPSFTGESGGKSGVLLHRILTRMISAPRLII